MLYTSLCFNFNSQIYHELSHHCLCTVFSHYFNLYLIWFFCFIYLGCGRSFVLFVCVTSQCYILKNKKYLKLFINSFQIMCDKLPVSPIKSYTVSAIWMPTLTQSSVFSRLSDIYSNMSDHNLSRYL